MSVASGMYLSSRSRPHDTGVSSVRINQEGIVMHTMLVAIGRLLLGLFFIVSAALKIKGGIDAGNLAGLTGYIGAHNLPQPQLIAYGVIAFEVLCGLAIVFGYFTMPIALLLAAFCLATAEFHNFWASPPDQFQGQLNNFLKNVGLAGGFLALAGDGIRVHLASKS
jgi:putative oxidoreductase